MKVSGFGTMFVAAQRSVRAGACVRDSSTGFFEQSVHSAGQVQAAFYRDSTDLSHRKEKVWKKS